MKMWKVNDNNDEDNDANNDDLNGHALAQEPLHWDHEINHFGRRFLDYHYYILVWTMLKSREEQFKRNNAFSQYDVWTRPCSRILALGSWNL